MTRLRGARILLCVTGGIAAYKAAAFTSTLVQSGAEIDVVMTPEAERFVTPLTFASLTARPVYTTLWDAPERIPHIRLVREARVALVAPATANTIAKLASGIADDVVTSALLAARIPIVLAPAMNDAMYAHEVTAKNLQTLVARGYRIAEPERGFLAERESGVGRLASPGALMLALERALATPTLTGKHVVVTAGPTREAMDPVRYVSNPSTGTMGVAIAREAYVRGARVSLILGPSSLAPDNGIDVHRVVTAEEMHAATMRAVTDADVVVAAAAVSDWRPTQRAEHKLKKHDGDVTVAMTRTPDVLASVGAQKGKKFLIGFAAETERHDEHAREKLRAKNLDAIAVNDVSGNRGFGEGENRLRILSASGDDADLGTAPKHELAERFWDQIERLMDERNAARN